MMKRCNKEGGLGQISRGKSIEKCFSRLHDSGHRRCGPFAGNNRKRKGNLSMLREVHEKVGVASKGTGERPFRRQRKGGPHDGVQSAGRCACGRALLCASWGMRNARIASSRTEPKCSTRSSNEPPSPAAAALR